MGTQRYMQMSFLRIVLLYFSKRCKYAPQGVSRTYTIFKTLIQMFSSIHFFGNLKLILTGILLVRTQIKVEPGGIVQILFLVCSNQIKMYLSALILYLKYLPSYARSPCYCKFKSQCLIIQYKYNDTLYVTWCGLISDFPPMGVVRWMDTRSTLYAPLGKLRPIFGVLVVFRMMQQKPLLRSAFRLLSGPSYGSMQRIFHRMRSRELL